MSRNEVKSLNDLAMAHGGQLTINPETGLPEAGFLSAILPMVAGAALMGVSGGAINPMTAGFLVGGGSYLMNPKAGLMGALSAGMGAYGGASLGQGLSGLATSEAGTTSANAMTAAADEAEKKLIAERAAMAQQQATEQALQSANTITPNATMPQAYQDFGAKTGFESAGLPTPTGGATVTAPITQAPNALDIQTARDAAMESAYRTPPSGFDAMYKGAESLVDNPTGDKFKTVGGGSYMGLAQKGLAAAAPAITAPAKLNMPAATSQAPIAPRYKFSPGMATPTPVAGITGTENTYFRPKYSAISADEAKSIYGFASGGVTYDPKTQRYTNTGGIADAYRPENTDVNFYNDSPGPGAGGGPAAASDSSSSTGSPTGSTMGDIGYAISNQSISPVAAAIASAVMDAVSPTSVTSVNAVNGMDAQSDAASAASAAAAAADASGGAPGMGGGVGPSSASDAGAPSDGGAPGMGGDSTGGGGGEGGEARGGLSPLFTHHMATGGGARSYRTSLNDSLEAAYAKAQESNDTATMRAIEEEMDIRNTSKAGMEQGLSGMKGLAIGGLSNARYNLGGYSDGGRLLRGPGDGVSDSIPAVIGKKQPARLADGEFVVPARIVSEIGNGSTEAGARKLYAMMDRIQAARSKTVGKGKVAKNTRADKYLPA
jgi:hypothetical protein